MLFAKRIVSMKVKIITSTKDFEALKNDWNSLLHDSFNDVVQMTHEWFISWWESFGGTNRLHIITVTDQNGQIAAIAPLMQVACSYRKIPIQKICFLANGQSPSADIIVKKDMITEGTQTVLQYLETSHGWGIIELQKLNATGNMFRFLSDYFKKSERLFGLKDNIESPFIS